MKILIVGAGYAGLFTALRLRLAGHEVTVVERRRIGSGPSGKNHGIVHSGALYSTLHPEIVPHTLASQHFYQRLFKSAQVNTKPSLYMASPSAMRDRMAAWNRTGIINRGFDKNRLYGTIRQTMLGDLEAVEIPQESVYSSYEVLSRLTSYCLHAGVQLHIGQEVINLEVSRNRVIGAQLQNGKVVQADRVLLASGIGTHGLTGSLPTSYSSSLKTRLDLMFVFKAKQPFERSIMVCEFGRPTIAPARDNYVLVSMYGSPQPLISGEDQMEVARQVSMEKLRDIEAFFEPQALDIASAQVYSCHKTEFYDPALVDQWGVNPGFHVHRHSDSGGPAGLYSTLAGKMTLSPQASQGAAELISGQPHQLMMDVPVSILTAALPANLENYIAPPTWTTQEQALPAAGKKIFSSLNY